jgi:hypothetical protein
VICECPTAKPRGVDICRTLGFWLILSWRRLAGLKCLPGLVGAELGLENRRARLSLRAMRAASR